MAALPLPRIDEGKYEILQRIKEGGMGSLYKVRHKRLNQIRVIKIIRSQFADSGEHQRRFEREAQAAARLEHPNIARLLEFEVDDADGFTYMVMEFIEGATLQETLEKSGPMTIDLTLEIARQGLKALRYMHSQGFVHRDIAPDNLMLTKDPEGMPLIKLIDLGIVKHLSEGVERLTGTNLFLGKVRYASPEQFEGGGLDNRSDLYSFGVMLYELLTGVYPYHGKEVFQLMSAHVTQPPRSFDETDPEGRVPDDVRDAVLRALRKKREERIQTAEEFLELLSRRPVSGTVVLDLEHTLSTTAEVLKRSEEAARRGTTQDRLDRNFGMRRTPGARPGLRVADPIAGRSDAELVTDLVTTARKLFEEKHWEEAQRRLYQALAVDHRNTEAQGLLDSIKESIERRRRSIAEAAARIEDLLRAERVEEASTELVAVRVEHGDDEQLGGFEPRIVDLRRMLQERARRQALDAARQGVEQALAAEDLDAARGLLAQAGRELGADPLWADLNGRIEGLEAELEERRRQQALRAACQEIEDLLGRQQADEAGAALEAARAAHGPDPSLAPLDLRLAELRGMLRERARRKGIRAALRDADALIEREDAEGAAAAIAAAVGRFGEDDAFGAAEQHLAALRARLEERRLEVERATRRERVETLLREAADQAAKEDYPGAVQSASEAVSIEPANAVAVDALASYRESEARQIEERRREEAMWAAAARIDRLLDREDLPAADQELRAALDSLGSDPRLDQCRSRADRLRGVLAERARREALAVAISAVEGALRAEDLDGAAALLVSARSAHGDAPSIRALEERLAAVREALAERSRREAISRAAAEVEDLIRAERLDEAVAALQAATASFGTQSPQLQTLQPEIRALRRRIEERERARARRAEIEKAAAAIEALLVREEAEPAQVELDRAISKLGADTRFDGLSARVVELRDVLAERERQAAEEARRREEERRQREAAQRRAAEERRRLEAEERARQESERLAREQAERDRLEAERLALEEKKAREDAARRAAEEKKARDEAARRALEEKKARAEAERVARERAERERLAAERLAREKAERERLEAERAAQVRAERERLEKERLALEREKAREEAERVAREQAQREREAAEQLAREAAERNRREEEERRRVEEKRAIAEAARRSREEKARREQGEALLRQAEKQESRGDLTGALETARRALEASPEAAREAIERYQRRVDDAARAARLEELLARARRELSSGSVERAEAALAAGRDEHEGSPDFRELQVEIETVIAYREQEAKRREAERKLADAIAAEAAAVETLLEKNRVDRAARRLATARAEHGEAPSLVELANRIDVLREALQAEKARQREAGGLAERWRAIPGAIKAGGGAALLVIGVVVAVALRPDAAPPTGPSEPSTGVTQIMLPVTIDAVPWAEVTRIVDAAGKEVALPTDAYTPLLLDLPPGEYQVFLSNPSFDGERELPLSIVPDQPAPAVLRLELEPIDVDAYFRDQGF